ncbi:Protein BOLA4 [Abeliophyllum distichum]|uniref:Protein BOLA4 n=1 Tax=Abeliophyllum distichum TaxID=126358 RepID=A0ABD1U174_9LAMI
MARALLMRPNVAAFGMLGSRALASLQGTTMLRRSYHLSSSCSLILLRAAGSEAYPIVSRRRSFCIRATNEFDNSALVGSPLMQSMENKIKEHLKAESVIVKDAYGDGRHVSIDVISSSFEGQSAVNRQRMVYKAIWEELQETVHAVDQMTTRTPSEASSSS